ncbi:MAG: hypothetical protein K6G10_07065 [Butyrivibrio sp.]|nr:hypothetical protein [Butyrivibrio sp.]
MQEMYKILEELQATALTPDQMALVKRLANTCGSNAQNVKNEILSLIDLEVNTDTVDVNEIKSIIMRAGNDI